MKLEKGATYISDRSILRVTIMNLYEATPEYVKATILKEHKKYGFFYGTEMVDLYFERIQHWKLVKETI